LNHYARRSALDDRLVDNELRHQLGIRSMHVGDTDSGDGGWAPNF